MGTLTVAEMQTEIRGNMGGRTDLNARHLTWINFVQDMIARQYDFPEMDETAESTLTASQATITIATRPRAVYSFRIINASQSARLTYIPNAQWDTLIPYPEDFSEAQPTHYTYWDNKFEFWRVPDAAYEYKMRWRKYPTVLTATTEKSDYDRKDDIIVCFATSWGFKSIGDTERMNYWGNHAWNQLKGAIKSESRKPDKHIVPISEIKELVGQPWLDPFTVSDR